MAFAAASSVCARGALTAAGLRPGCLRALVSHQPRLVNRIAFSCKTRCSQVARAAATAAPYEPNFLDGQRRVFAAYQLYKGKAAAAFKVINPQWQRLADGSFTLSRAGTLLVEVAPAQQGTGSRPGERRYEWDSKLTFALSASELGEMIASQGKGIQPIFHDPGMNSGTQGQITKSFRYQPMGTEGQDLYLSVEATENGKQRKFGLPVTRGEHEVITRIAKTIIPHILGINEVLAQVNDYVYQPGVPGMPGGPDAPPF